MCGRGVRSILLLPLVARCLETIDVCIWLMFVLCGYFVCHVSSMGRALAFRADGPGSNPGPA